MRPSPSTGANAAHAALTKDSSFQKCSAAAAPARVEGSAHNRLIAGGIHTRRFESSHQWRSAFACAAEQPSARHRSCHPDK